MRTDIDPSFAVGLDITVIPDGFTKSGACRLSLQIAPRPDPSDNELKVDIRCWPEQVAALTKCVRIAAGKVTFPSSGDPLIDAHYLKGTVSPDTSPLPDEATFITGANELWRTIFTAGEANLNAGFTRLRDALPKAPTQAPRMTLTPLAARNGVRPMVTEYLSADMGRVLDSISHSAVAVSVQQRLAALTKPAPKTSNAKKPGETRASTDDDLQPCLEEGRMGVAWWRHLHEQWFTPPKVRGAEAQRDPRTKVVSHDVLMRMEETGSVLARVAGGGEAPDLSDGGERKLALDTAIDFFERQIKQPRFWAYGIGTVDADRGRKAFQDEVGRFVTTWGLGAMRPKAPEYDECKEIEDRAPARKLAGILSYPTLAKYMRLIVDVVVERGALASYFDTVSTTRRAYGVIAADLVDVTPCPPPDTSWGDISNGGTLRWTATVLGPSTATTEYFGPCSEREIRNRGRVKNDEIYDGLINLSVTLGKDDAAVPRYVLSDHGVTTAIAAVRQTAADIVAADREGLTPNDQITRIPGFDTRGITLCDRDVKSAHAEIWSRKLLPPRRLVFAKQLIEGHRYDVALLKTNGTGWETKDRWRSLTSRTVAFPKHMPRAFSDAMSDLRFRDDGRVTRGTRVTNHTNATGDAQDVVALADEVFTWTGESLGGPSLQHERSSHVCFDEDPRSIKADMRVDLGIELEFDLPAQSGDDTTDCLPPLRERRSYVFGARACFTNGCGPTFDDARQRYGAMDHRVVLGSPDGSGFTFTRRADVPAPDVLLPWDDLLVSSPAPARQTPGENIATLVVRSGRLQNETARRMLMPARSTFDASEQAGVFDQSHASRPSGAFAGFVRFRACPTNGTFPVARDGSWTFASCDAPPETGTCSAPSTPAPDSKPTPHHARGSVLVLDAETSAPALPFYPDPYGARVCARFSRNGCAAPHYGELNQPVRFWPEGRPPEAAMPIVLELRRAHQAQDEHRGWFEQDWRTIRVRQYRGDRVTLPLLALYLEPGEDIDLELWAYSDSRDHLEHHRSIAGALQLLRKNVLAIGITSLASAHGVGGEQLAAYSKRLDQLISPKPEIAGPALDEVLCRGPLASTTTKKTLRVVHAVDRPLVEPEVQRTDKDLLHAVVITVAPETGDPNEVLPAELKSWSEYAIAHQGVPEMTWPSEPHGTTTFFVGTVELSRRSTVSLRCEGYWDEYEPAGLRQDPKTKLWDFVRRRVPTVRLFGINDVSAADAVREEPLQLLTEDGEPPASEAEKYRGLSYAFPDGKARYVQTRLIGTSRFTEFFPAETAADLKQLHETGVGKYERQSSRSVEVGVPCTFRPRVPDIDRIVPVFRWQTRGGPFDRDVSWERTASLRVYLEPSTWYSTGQGEQLAVAFGPFTTPAGDPLTICTFEAAVAEFGQFITRWGGDPVHFTGPLAELMPIASLTDGSTPIGPLRLPFALEAVVTEVLETCESGTQLPAGTVVTVEGDNFIHGVTARVNNEPARKVTLLSSSTVLVELDKAATCPLDVQVRNPDLNVTIKAFTPELDRVGGQWYCDLPIDHGESYYPFVQLGVARYQPLCAPNLELSPPVAAWAQLPASRTGHVTFHEDRTIVIEHGGVGFGPIPADSGAPSSRDVPLLNLRLLRASSPGRVPGRPDGGVAWTPVVDINQCPIERLRVPPIQRDFQVWWCEKLKLPPARPGVRYGLLIEEVELMTADPEPTEHPDKWQHVNGQLTVTAIEEERGPLFLHFVDLGA